MANSGIDTHVSGTTTQSVFGSQQEFALNGIFRPQFGITNHAMLGWSELNALYRKYKIRGIGVKLTMNNVNADGGCVGIWFQAPGSTKC